ncbi:hypothetical protein Bca52824_084479 [Brassica carinata]|uniref:Uncharacterized protein n=1 Tax=Brassica carinata TaxID=52824 RepID=A0A8X7PPD4_BRACI|nr:hypothetical protein Bca52824_084479 [Brassica carinata]
MIAVTYLNNQSSLPHLLYTFTDSKAQVTAIHLIKATRYSANILEKPDQCRAIYACSHLFWVYDIYGIRDGERVLLFLKRALRIAIEAQEMAKATRGSTGPVTLFVEILNKSVF